MEVCCDNTTMRADDIRRLERCVADIGEWMRTNMLMLNDEKTELLVFHHKTNECSEVPQAVVVGDSSITSAKTTRNLGVIFDTTLSLNKHELHIITFVL